MKRIAQLCAAALVLLVIVGFSTRVLSSDAANLTEDSLYPGDLALTVTGESGCAIGATTAAFGGDRLTPGSAIGPATFLLSARGSCQGRHVRITVRTSHVDNPSYDQAALGPNIEDMNSQIAVTQMTYGGVSLLGCSGGVFDQPMIRQADADGDGVITMAELDGTVLDGLPAPTSGGAISLTIAAEIPLGAGNGIQGDQAGATIAFGFGP